MSGNAVRSAGQDLRRQLIAQLGLSGVPDERVQLTLLGHHLHGTFADPHADPHTDPRAEPPFIAKFLPVETHPPIVAGFPQRTHAGTEAICFLFCHL